MKLTDLITHAQTLAGIQTFQGNAIDVNQMAASIAVFHQTLNSINNDPSINLVQSMWDYQAGTEENPRFPGNAPSPDPGPGGSWIDLPILRPDADAPPPIGVESLNLKFPDHRTPFPASDSYPLPSDCRRVLKAIGGSIELRKTDFSEIVRSRSIPGQQTLFAVNGRRLELAMPGPAIIVYAKEFREFMPQDEVDLPTESLDYVANATALSLAMGMGGSKERVSMLQAMAEKSYNALVGNLRVNEGDKTLSIYNSLNRFSGRGYIL